MVLWPQKAKDSAKKLLNPAQILSTPLLLLKMRIEPIIINLNQQFSWLDNFQLCLAKASLLHCWWHFRTFYWKFSDFYFEDLFPFSYNEETIIQTLVSVLFFLFLYLTSLFCLAFPIPQLFYLHSDVCLIEVFGSLSILGERLEFKPKVLSNLFTRSRIRVCGWIS